MSAVLAVAPLAGAQDKPTQEQSAAKPFKPEELEQIVAPIALYPDGVVAQVLMASTYPLEVIEAARFAKSHANLRAMPSMGHEKDLGQTTTSMATAMKAFNPDRTRPSREGQRGEEIAC